MPPPGTLACEARAQLQFLGANAGLPYMNKSAPNRVRLTKTTRNGQTVKIGSSLAEGIDLGTAT
jgi:hypothetical protein